MGDHQKKVLTTGWTRFVDVHSYTVNNQYEWYTMMRLIGKKWNELTPAEKYEWECPSPQKTLLPKYQQTGCQLYLKISPNDPKRLAQWKILPRPEKERWFRLESI